MESAFRSAGMCLNLKYIIYSIYSFFYINYRRISNIKVQTPSLDVHTKSDSSEEEVVMTNKNPPEFVFRSPKKTAEKDATRVSDNAADSISNVSEEADQDDSIVTVSIEPLVELTVGENSLEASTPSRSKGLQAVTIQEEQQSSPNPNSEYQTAVHNKGPQKETPLARSNKKF